jgi:hypothetical protein
MSKPRNNKVTTFHEEPFTNHLGQVVNPGDKVVVVAVGYNHVMSVRQGTYLGTRVARPDSGYPRGHVVSVSVRVKDKVWKPATRAAGPHWKYDGHYVDGEVLRAYTQKRVYALK